MRPSEHSRRDRQETYAVVRIKDGRGVIEDLFINDVPIREFIKTMK